MAHRPEPTKATEREEWNREHAKTKQKSLNAYRQKLKDFNVKSAMDRYLSKKDGTFNGTLKFGETKELDNAYGEKLDISVDDEFGTLLKQAIAALNKNPNDFNAKIVMSATDLFYNYDSRNTVKEATGAGETFYNFPLGELNEQGELVVDNKTDDQTGSTEVLDSTGGQTNKIEEEPKPKIENKPPTTLSSSYKRPSPSERQKRRMEDVLVRGRPGAKFKLDRERKKGTNIKDLFKSNIEDE